MKLLDTRGGNTKLEKTGASAPFRYAGLSLYPDLRLCPGSKAAGCMDTCLAEQGRGVFSNVRESRQTKSQFFHANRPGFLKQLHRELDNFEKLCQRTGERGAVRLNVLSDVAWEMLGVPEEHPGLLFVDYTKRAGRLNNTPENYKLIFSYSGRPQYRNQNRAAFLTGLPVAVVFRGGFPRAFRGRPVIDGDRDDIRNAFAVGQIVALTPKGSAARDRSGFVVDNPNLIVSRAGGC